jgi:hypothetical protein
VSKEEVTRELNNWKQQFSEVSKLFDSPLEGRSEEENLTVISQRYSELKARVLEYDKQLEKELTNGMLSELELSILVPAIHDVALHCSARKSSMNREELSSSIYDGEDYLTYYLSQLNL